MTMISSDQPDVPAKSKFEEMYEQQGKGSHQFTYHAGDDRYFLDTVTGYEHLRAELVEAQVKVTRLRGWLADWAQEDEIDRDVARTIADLFDIELTREVEWTATVRFSGTAVIPLWADEDTLATDMRFSARWAGDTSWDVYESDDYCEQFDVTEA